MDPREPTWKDKTKIGNLMTRLRKHAEGQLPTEMTATQLKAAEIFLRKTVPDLARTEHTGKDGAAIETKDVTKSDADILAQYLGKR